MKSEQLYTLLLNAAKISGWTNLVVIGSQAIHGTVEDPEIDVVARSPDADFYRPGGYPSDAMWEHILSEIGQDSDYHIKNLVYAEAVPQDLVRLPLDWERRAKTKTIGTITVGDSEVPVTVTFPDIYDLTVSKLSINRPKDIAFMQAVVEQGLVEQPQLEDRFKQAPRTSKEVIALGLAQIAAAFTP